MNSDSDLTKEYFQQWMTQYSALQNVDEKWEQISESRDFIECFTFVPDRYRSIMFMELHAGISAHTLGSYYNLTLRLQTLFPAQFTTDLILEHDVWDIAADFPEPRSSNFDEAIAELETFFIEEEDDYIWGRHYYVQAMILLKAIYGERPILDLMGSWMRSDITPELSQIIFIADNWSDYRDYPFEWSLSMTPPAKKSKLKTSPRVRR